MVVAAILAGVGNKHADEPVLHVELTEKMPNPDDVIHSGCAQKCPFADAGSNWRPIICSLTGDQFFLSKKLGDKNCVDRIPLRQVISINSKDYPGAGVYVFELQTAPEGRNNGRKYQFRVESPEVKDEWLAILQATKSKDDEKYRLNCLQTMSYHAKLLHDSNEFQQLFGSIIVANFIISLVQAEMVPEEGSSADDVFNVLDLVCTGLFTVELIITFVGHPGLMFLKDAWRIFDTSIVAVSLLSASGAEMPAVKSVRAIRVLRAVRLLKKSKSLKPIVYALFSSVFPVLNSMSLLGLITAIYASMAVGLFGEEDPVNFGKLSYALFTMFQVLCLSPTPASGFQPRASPPCSDSPCVLAKCASALPWGCRTPRGKVP